MKAKAAAGQDVSSELLEGAALVETCVRLNPEPAAGRHAEARPGTGRLADADRSRALAVAGVLRGTLPMDARVLAASDPELRRLMDQCPDRRLAASPELRTRMGDAGYRIVAERFSMEAHVRQIEEIYDEELSRVGALAPLRNGNGSSSARGGTSSGRPRERASLEVPPV